MKFSIIIPVYNVEKYIEKCLKSVFDQTYKNYEVIIVNDGSTDGSEKIIKEYIKNKKNVVYIKQKNQGQSQARNNGVKKATGEYLLFLDSDDYIDKNLLTKLKNKDSDLIRFQVAEVNETSNTLYHENPIKKTTGIKAFKELSKYHYVENVCAYCYNREFYLKNKFSFKNGLLHEDFGLIPFIIFKAITFESIDYIGYYYVQRENSTMNNKNYEKEVKKAFDLLDQYIILKNKFLKYDYTDTKLFLSFIANSSILKLKCLKGKDYKKYLEILKQEKAFDYILKDNLKRKIKFIIMKLNLKLYLKIFS